MIERVLLLLLWLLAPAALVLAQESGASAFSAEERARIASFGPWPAARQPDPGNRVSGQPLAIELGRRLFRDARMSPVGYIACVTCHQPDRSFTDQKSRAHGLADLPRNTPALANLRQQRWYGWGGSSDSLWMASIRPMLDPREFDGSPAIVARLFDRDPELAACYRAVFRQLPGRDAERTMVNAAKALAAFQETLNTGVTPFDAFREALLRNDLASAASYPIAARRGLKLFVGQARCANCHSGPNFSDGVFHAGVAPEDAIVAAADSGRLEGARSLMASRLNLLGRYNDDRHRANAIATRQLRLQEQMRGQFRTPSLRNVAVTAPYLHDGRFDGLREAATHAQRQPSAASLSASQVDDLLAFLLTLTDQVGERRPWSSSVVTPCP